MTLPDAPDAFRLWLATLPDVEAIADGPGILERFLQARGAPVASVAYTLYAVGDLLKMTVYHMPRWATDVVHAVDSGACQTIGEMRRWLHGEQALAVAS